MEFWPIFSRPSGTFYFNQSLPLMQDVNVRKALQMSVDRETINASYNKGLGDPTPYGLVGQFTPEYSWPYENWPDEVKHEYEYHPEEAEALLDAAGYPRGADGIRFKTVLEVSLPIFAPYVQHSELAASYWAEIGVDVEVRETETSVLWARVKEGDFDMITTSSGTDSQPLTTIMAHTSDSLQNPPNVQDPVYDAMVADAQAATTTEERKRLIKRIDMYMTEKHWYIWGSRVPTMNVLQPWVIGYNGEFAIGTGQIYQVFARLWIDSELKEAMGY